MGTGLDKGNPPQGAMSMSTGGEDLLVYIDGPEGNPIAEVVIKERLHEGVVFKVWRVRKAGVRA